MKNLLLESQEDFKILKGTFTNKKGIKSPIFYLKGNTFDLHKIDNLRDKYNGYWDGKAKMWYWFADKNNPQETIDTKIQPLINRVNNFYKYTLQIDDLINQIEDYTPVESESEVVATSEEANAIADKMKSFKEMLINIDSDEDFKSKMGALIDFKAAQGYPYSLANVMLIKVQRPNATIVNSAKDWKTAYNRTVNEGAKPIFVWKPRSGGFRGGSGQAQKDFLASVGKTSVRDLNPNEKMRLKKDVLTSQPTTGGGFYLVGHYDVSDTTQIEGTEDYIEKAQAASSKMNIDTDTSNIVSDEIKPIYKGLLAYAEDLGITVNNPTPNVANINVPQNAGNDARITMGLAKNIFGEILHGQYIKDKGNLVSKLHVGGEDNSVKGQQTEIAAWMFMYAFNIDFKITQIDMATLLSNNKNNMEKVFNTIAKSVDQVVDYVNVNIKDNKQLTEIDEVLPQGKHITAIDVAKVLGVEKQYQEITNNANIQELHERLIRKVLRLI
jgi:hypothetical protein